MASLGLKRSLFQGSLGTPLRRANYLTGLRGAAWRLRASYTELGFFWRMFKESPMWKKCFKSKNRSDVSFTYSFCYPERVASVGSVMLWRVVSVRFCYRLTQLRPGSIALLHTRRTQFNQLGSCEIRRLTQLRSTDIIWRGWGVLHAWPAVNNAWRPTLGQTPIFPWVESNA